MSKVEREVAEKEVTAWLDKKKIFASTREALKDNIEILIDAISEGVLSLDETTFVFKQELMFPFGDEVKIIQLSYKPRLNDKMLRPHLNGVKTTDADGRLLAYVAALTGENREILASMDSTDKKISMAIAVFFL